MKLILLSARRSQLLNSKDPKNKTKQNKTKQNKKNTKNQTNSSQLTGKETVLLRPWEK